MRWVLSSLMVLALTPPPALSAAQCKNHLVTRMFSGSYLNTLASALTGPAFIMRGLLVAFGLIVGLLSPAFAGDYDLPILRGSQSLAPVAPVTTVGPATFTRWSGFYFGGAFSYGSAHSDFSTASQPLVHFSLQHTTVEDQDQPSDFVVLGKGSGIAAGVGGFLGYNIQWQDLTTGIEATYTYTNLNTTAPSTPIARIFPAINTQAAVSANGHLDLIDYTEVRARAGYVVGNLLPYGFIGVAMGRANYSVSATTDVTQTILPTPIIRALELVLRQRHAKISPFLPVPDKATHRFGASLLAAGLIGR